MIQKILLSGALTTAAAILINLSTLAAAPGDPSREPTCPNCTFQQKEELKCKRNCDEILQICVSDYVKKKSEAEGITCEDNYTVMGIRRCEDLEREGSKDPSCAEANAGCYYQCKL